MYTFHYFSCSVEASQSLPFFYPVFQIFFSLCIFRCFVICHVLCECGCAWIWKSLLVSVVYPFWIWCVYALNWYRYMKTTHIVAKWLLILWLLPMLMLHHKPSRLSDPKKQNNEYPFFFHSCALCITSLFFLFCPTYSINLIISMVFFPVRSPHFNDAMYSNIERCLLCALSFDHFCQFEYE